MWHRFYKRIVPKFFSKVSEKFTLKPVKKKFTFKRVNLRGLSCDDLCFVVGFSSNLSHHVVFCNEVTLCDILDPKYTILAFSNVNFVLKLMSLPSSILN